MSRKCPAADQRYPHCNEEWTNSAWFYSQEKKINVLHSDKLSKIPLFQIFGYPSSFTDYRKDDDSLEDSDIPVGWEGNLHKLNRTWRIHESLVLSINMPPNTRRVIEYELFSQGRLQIK